MPEIQAFRGLRYDLGHVGSLSLADRPKARGMDVDVIVVGSGAAGLAADSARIETQRRAYAGEVITALGHVASPAALMGIDSIANHRRRDRPGHPPMWDISTRGRSVVASERISE